MNSRSIPPDAWEHAREVLVFYFSHRNGWDQAQDLAQDTLTALWKREDYEFDKEEDFQKICYAFARRISAWGYRTSKRNATELLDVDVATPEQSVLGMSGPVLSLLLEDIKRLGKAHLNDSDWEAICAAAEDSISDMPAQSLAERNRFRVRLFRARRKLEKITGWKTSADT